MASSVLAGTKKLIFDTRKLAVTEMEGTLAETPDANQADTSIETQAEAPAAEMPTVGGSVSPNVCLGFVALIPMAI